MQENDTGGAGGFFFFFGIVAAELKDYLPFSGLQLLSAPPKADFITWVIKRFYVHLFPPIDDEDLGNIIDQVHLIMSELHQSYESAFSMDSVDRMIFYKREMQKIKAMRGPKNAGGIE